MNITHYVTRIQEGSFEGICVIHVSGRLTLGESSSGFRNYIQQRISDGLRFFILDFSDLQYVDSSGVAELVSAFTRIKMRAGKVVLLSCRSIKDALEITRLKTVFEIADDLSQALSKFRGESFSNVPDISYEDKFSITVEEDKGKKTLVVNDKLSEEPHRIEYKIREIPSEDSKSFTPKSLVLVVLTSVITLGVMIFGLIWAVRAVSSLVLLTLVFSIALLFFIILVVLVLLLSGHLSEKTASKLFGGVLAKVPGLGLWVPKASAKKRS